MRTLAGLAGLLLILLTLGDIVKTTLALRGGGYLSKRLNRWVWHRALRLHRRIRSHRLMAYLGPALLLLNFLVWILFIWLGWSLVFMASETAVVSSPGGTPANTASRFYFAGFTLITLGIGDYKPQGAPWQVATVLASTLGFFIVTLSITYLLSVLSAVVQKRQTASYLASLGLTPSDLITHHWEGESFDDLVSHRSTLMSLIGTSAQQHLAYPVLHYFHSASPRTALALRITALDEAMSYLSYGVVSGKQSAKQLHPLREEVAEFLRSLDAVLFDPANRVPPLPPLSPLRSGGLQTAEEEEFRHAMKELGTRRALLLALVERDGWNWQQVYEPSDATSDDS